jgi:hypothetical protein
MADPTAPEPLRLEVEAEPLSAELGPELRSALLAHPVVRSQYPNADLWVLGVDALEKGDEPNGRFRAILADMAGNDVLEADGRPWDIDDLWVDPTARPRLPTADEHEWAVGVLKSDAVLGPRIDAGQVEPYRPVPPLANVQDPDGSVDRAVTVGLRETDDEGAVRHRIVAVRVADGEVVSDRLPSPDPATPEDGALVAGAPPPAAAAATGEAQARVRVWRGDELLWDLVVVRPSASSGANGSGLELRLVDYQRVRVLHRAHVPIANVAYPDGSPCLSARLWLNEEAAFAADGDGDEPVPGFRVCSAAPVTFGGGDFRGVALWLDGDALRIVSEVEAGWHRYALEWALHADGSIRPRVRFGATRNPCTATPHTHHVYWRLDFDVDVADLNLVQEHNEPNLPGQLAPWHTIRYEVRRPRDDAHQRRWRVRTVRSAHGYTVAPGPGDGTADAFGAGDVWILAHRPEEVDDGVGVTTDPTFVRAGLDRFVSGELIERRDVVLWYAAHGEGASASAASGAGSGVGPDLQPFNWRPPAERGPYIPIEPPPQPDPDAE